MTLKNSILAALLALLCGATHAQPTLQEEFLAALRAKNAEIETIACDFTQVKHNSLLAGDAESRGKFRFRRPCRLALLYDAPAGNRIVMGETEFLIEAGGMRNVVKIAANPFFLQMQEVFAACFSGDIEALCSEGEFRCEQCEGTYTVRIVPRSKRARRYVSELELVFSSRDMLLDELCMREPTGNYTRYRFENRKTNLPVADDCFDGAK